MQFICLLFIYLPSPGSITHVCTEPNTHPHTHRTHVLLSKQAVRHSNTDDLLPVIFKTFFFLFQISLTHCVILDKSLNLPGPQFPQLYKGENHYFKNQSRCV